MTSEMDDTKFWGILGFIAEEVPYLLIARQIPFDGVKKIITNVQIQIR